MVLQTTNLFLKGDLWTLPQVLPQGGSFGKSVASVSLKRACLAPSLATTLGKIVATLEQLHDDKCTNCNSYLAKATTQVAKGV